MNTSAKGSAYENAVRHELEKRDCTVIRSAASKGPFDLFAYRLRVPRLGLFQIKAGRLSCAGAQRLADEAPEVPEPLETFVVHECRSGCRQDGHVEQRFCLHSKTSSFNAPTYGDNLNVVGGPL